MNNIDRRRAPLRQVRHYRNSTITNMRWLTLECGHKMEEPMGHPVHSIAKAKQINTMRETIGLAPHEDPVISGRRCGQCMMALEQKEAA